MIAEGTNGYFTILLKSVAFHDAFTMEFPIKVEWSQGSILSEK